MRLTDSLSTIKGVGPETSTKFYNFGIRTISDLLDHWPRKYEDYSLVTKISELRPGLVTVRGQIGGIRSKRSRRGLTVTEATVTDDTGVLHIVWFNQPYRSAAKEAEYYVSGVFDMHSGRLGMVNPSIELADGEAAGGKILPVYPETKGINSALIRRIMAKVLPATSQIAETLPKFVVEETGLMSRAEAVRALHSPVSSEELESSRKRLSFEELFQLQLGTALMRAKLSEERAKPIKFDEKLAKQFVSHLPFDLTDDQRKVVWQIYKDIGQQVPMNRLVEGDVGSGKTAVAAMAALMVMKAGHQVMYMAPTEILARQQAESLSLVFAHTEWADQIGLLIGALKKPQKDALHARIASGECRLVVGTHALLSDKVVTDDVGLVVIDEQHRFGVEQRQRLRGKAGFFPHVLLMTATPIPRSLALTLYGELDLSIIKMKPAGRMKIETKVINFGARHQLYQDVDMVLQQGRQAFVVCPLIAESDSLQVLAAENLYKDLKEKQLKHRRIGLLHGKMKSDEKDKIMKTFADGGLDVLVSTTVIEVGVNVPNASVMVIEGAERFGLSQIHQLRGRIGRGEHQGYCYLVPSEGIGLTKRLRAVESTDDGFRLAELDLSLRGPGAIYGTRQSGVLDLRIASLNDRASVQKAKEMAEKFMLSGENLLKYKELNERVAHFQSLSKLN